MTAGWPGSPDGDFFPERGGPRVADKGACLKKHGLAVQAGSPHHKFELQFAGESAVELCRLEAHYDWAPPTRRLAP